MSNIFPIRFKPRKMTTDELERWEQFKLGISLDTLTEEKSIGYVCKLYSEVFNKEYHEPNNIKIIAMIDKLTKVYDRQSND
jgi:hypothetical protein